MNPIIIAHRGASAYLPEHTLAAKALAHAMGADYLEQDVVATRDDELIVLHDIHLDHVCNVAEVYPQRARPDGRYYARDFDLAELQTLTVRERENADGEPVYPGRFPPRSGEFGMHTLAAEIEFIQGLNSATGRKTGIYTEIKRPAWHLDEGVDITRKVLDVLERFGYRDRNDSVYLQCFDAREVRRIRHELGSELLLIQLIAENSWLESDTDYDALRRADGLADIARTADGIGPWMEQLYTIESGDIRSTQLTEQAHALGLDVHPYTFRCDSLPTGFESFDALIGYAVGKLSVDGLFTDFPDRARQAINALLN